MLRMVDARVAEARRGAGGLPEVWGATAPVERGRGSPARVRSKPSRLQGLRILSSRL